MPLVEYSDSEDSQQGDNLEKEDQRPKGSQLRKRKRSPASATNLPPLPDTFHDLYASSVRLSTKDDPALHGGRQRITPHVMGQWPTHVYIEWYPSRTESEMLKHIVNELDDSHPNNAAKIQSLLESDLGAELPLHISLSSPLSLSTDQREPFVERLRFLCGEAGIRPFEVQVVGIEWVTNHERTRWFLVLKLVKPAGNCLNLLLWASNQTAIEFSQPPLYTTPELQQPAKQRKPRPSLERGKTSTPSRHKLQFNGQGDCSTCFHISIAWSLQAPPKSLLARMKALDVGGLTDMRLVVGNVKAKVGNVVTCIPLSTKTVVTKGILGA